MLMPLTFGMDPVGAFIMFGGIYYGAMYGGSTASILVKMPGEASSVMTAVDGFRMTCKGRGGAALATAAIGSFIAGTFATLMLMLMAPALVEFALAFGPWEYFALMVLALTAITGLSSESPAKGAFATLLGLALGTIGIDLQTGQARFTFGAQGLLDEETEARFIAELRQDFQLARQRGADLAKHDPSAQDTGEKARKSPRERVSNVGPNRCTDL